MSVWSKVMTPADGVTWVTGASAGIGKATALRLADDGWTVWITARRAEAPVCRPFSPKLEPFLSRATLRPTSRSGSRMFRL